MSSKPNTSFNFKAMTASEYESLHWPASSTLGIPPISPRFNLLYLYFAQPAVKITVSAGNSSATSVKYCLSRWRPSQPAITTNFFIAPDFTASTTLSAKANTWLCANPPTIFPVSICVGGWHFFASSIIFEKSFCFPSSLSAICFTPGQPVIPVVKILSL